MNLLPFSESLQLNSELSIDQATVSTTLNRVDQTYDN